MATELKTDSWCRYMMYRHDERYMTFHPEEDRKQAVDAGRKFVVSAYADVWAKDAGLVSRVRAFFGENFHWHNRLSKSGSDQDVAQTLMEMVRGGSIVVIPEEPVCSGGIAWPPKKAAASFWGVENYDATPYVSVKDRYRTQLERMNAERPMWAETEAMMDSINAGFMRQMAGSSPLLDSLFQAAGWTDKYAAPNDTGLSLLGDAQPFEYGNVALPGDDIDLAGLPFDGPGSSWIESGPGMKKQWRMYGANGAPTVDIDFDNHHGQPDPHAHNWDGLSRDQGWPVSILP